MINHNNIEDYIIDYVSNELSDSETEALFEYLNAHPEFKILLDEYQQTLLNEDDLDDITVPDFSHLKKAEVSNGNSYKYSKWILPFLVMGGALFLYSKFNENEKGKTREIENKIAEVNQNSNSESSLVANNNQASTQTLKVNDSIKNSIHPPHYQRSSPIQGIHVTKEEISTKNNEEIQPILHKEIKKLQPIAGSIKIPVNSLIVYTQLIPESNIPQDYLPEVSNEMEVTIGGRSLDLELKPIKDIKNKLEEVKETINEKVENSHVDPNGIWKIINN